MNSLEYLQQLVKLSGGSSTSEAKKSIETKSQQSLEQAFNETMNDASKAQAGMQRRVSTVPATAKTLNPTAIGTGKGRVQKPKASSTKTMKLKTPESSKLSSFSLLDKIAMMNKVALSPQLIRRAIAKRMMGTGQGPLTPELYNLYMRRLGKPQMPVAKPTFSGELEAAGIDALRAMRKFDPKQTIREFAGDAGKAVGNWGDRNAIGIAAGMYAIPNMLPSFSPTIKIKQQGGSGHNINVAPQFPGGIRYAN